MAHIKLVLLGLSITARYMISILLSLILPYLYYTGGNSLYFLAQAHSIDDCCQRIFLTHVYCFDNSIFPIVAGINVINLDAVVVMSAHVTTTCGVIDDRPLKVVVEAATPKK